MNRSGIFLSLALTLFSTQLWALGGDLVNNGGGIAEKNILYAYEKIDTYVVLCLKSTACKLDDQQKTILQQIYNGLSQEKQVNAQSPQIIFDSEKKNPGTFMIDGNVRVAKTGSTIGSPIYINVDLLYSKNDSGGYDAVTLPEAVAILVHEFGHHYGNYTHEALDLIGVRVSLLMQQKLIMTPMLPWDSNISASVYNPNFGNSFPQVLLNIGKDVIDVSIAFANEVHCEVFTVPIPILPIPDLELITKTPSSSLFYNIHWDGVKDKGDHLEVQIMGNVSNNCEYKNDVFLRNNNYQLTISFNIKKVNGQYLYDPTSLSMNQFKNPWWKLIRLP